MCVRLFCAHSMEDAANGHRCEVEVLLGEVERLQGAVVEARRAGEAATLTRTSALTHTKDAGAFACSVCVFVCDCD